MARRYEIVYLFDSSLEESQVNKHLERFHALLKHPDHADPVKATSHWGKRSLAYPIKGREAAYYAVVQFETHASVLAEFERLIKLEEAVLRHQLVVNEGEVPEPAAAYAAASDDGDSSERGSGRSGGRGARDAAADSEGEDDE